jgi:hypothetical protein
MNELFVGQCGIVVYGVEYIRRHIDNIMRWKGMNPSIKFTIISTRLLTDSIEQQVELEEQIKREFDIDMIYIENDMLTWYKAHIKEHRQLAFLSDIIRWHGINVLKDKGNPVFLLEADTICERVNWMEEYDPLPGITIFGPDRSCIVYSKPDGDDPLVGIIKMFDNVYKYLITQNVFGGNFEHLMYEDDEYIQRKLERDEHYQFLTRQPVNTQELTRFIEDLPYSILGIQILQIKKFKFNRPYFLQDKYNAESYGDYTHLAAREWSGHGGKIKKSGKSKRNKTKKSKTKKTKTKKVKNFKLI